MKKRKTSRKKVNRFSISSLDQTGKFRTHLLLCHKALNFAAGKMNVKSKELSLTFVSQLTMKKLNRKYRGLNYPTDVLSFGDFEIIISPQVAAKNAAEDGKPVSHELVLLTVHGLLHLLGYDHEKSSDAKVMFKIQDRLTKRAIKRLC